MRLVGLLERRFSPCQSRRSDVQERLRAFGRGLRSVQLCLSPQAPARLARERMTSCSSASSNATPSAEVGEAASFLRSRRPVCLDRRMRRSPGPGSRFRRQWRIEPPHCRCAAATAVHGVIALSCGVIEDRCRIKHGLSFCKIGLAEDVLCARYGSFVYFASFGSFAGFRNFGFLRNHKTSTAKGSCRRARRGTIGLLFGTRAGWHERDGGDKSANRRRRPGIRRRRRRCGSPRRRPDRGPTTRAG